MSLRAKRTSKRRTSRCILTRGRLLMRNSVARADAGGWGLERSCGPQVRLLGVPHVYLTRPPLQIGPYRIVRPLSEGGMGVVYEAIQAHIERRVALKILLPQHATNRETLQRFFNEARAVNLIEHPSIVQLSDYGQQPDGTAYLVMEYLRGEALSERLDRTHGAGRRLPLEDALQITAQIAGALAAARAKSVIHRDLKPSNVMLVKDPAFPRGERVKVLDFGIAKLAHSQAKGTAPNAVVGTPQYMSPEQCRGAGSVDEKTDIYALGLILYEMIAGRPPFIAESAIEYIGQHAFREPPPLQNFVPKVFDDLAAFVHSLLLKDKALRPPMQKAETELSRLLARLSNVPLPASNSTADDEDQTRRYLPPPSSPATIVDPSRKALRPARSGQTLMVIGVSTAFALTIVAIVWGGYAYWARRSTPLNSVAVKTAISTSRSRFFVKSQMDWQQFTPPELFTGT